MIRTLSPTTHTPPDPRRGGERSPRSFAERRQCRTIGLKTMRLRDLTSKLDRMAPEMSDGHAGRLEQALSRALAIIEQEHATLCKWKRARGLGRRDAVDSAELRSIENGGNG